MVLVTNLCKSIFKHSLILSPVNFHQWVIIITCHQHHQCLQPHLFFHITFFMFIKIQFARSKFVISQFRSLNQISVPEMVICTFLYVFLDLNLYRRSVPEMNSRVCLIEITSVKIKTNRTYMSVHVNSTGNITCVYRGFKIILKVHSCTIFCLVLQIQNTEYSTRTCVFR